MNKIHIVIFIVACVFSVSAYAKSKCHLTVQIVEYPPLAIKDSQGVWRGKNIFYLDALFSRAECTYSLIETPFARGIALLKSGNIDMTVNISKTKDREAFLHFIGPQREEVIRLATNSQINISINTWSEFISASPSIIWQTGAYFGQAATDVIEKNPLIAERVIYVSNNQIMVYLVEKNRADGFFVESSFFAHQKKYNKQYANLTLQPLIVNRESVYFAFSKTSNSDSTIRRFKRAYQQLVDHALLSEIENRPVEY